MSNETLYIITLMLYKEFCNRAEFKHYSIGDITTKFYNKYPELNMFSKNEKQ